MRSLITFFAASILVGSCACDKCPAQGPRQLDLNKKVTGATDGMYRSGQTIDLPTGRDRLQLTVAMPPNLQADPLAIRVASWFTGGAKRADNTPLSANPRLRAIQDQTAYRYVFTSDPNWAKTARAEMLGTGLTVMLTGPDGKIMRDGTGGVLMGADELASITSAEEMADYLLAGAEKYTRAPMLQGLVQGMGSVSTMLAPGRCARCGTPTNGGPCPNCTPQLPPDSTLSPPRMLPTIKPNLSRAFDGWYAIAAGVIGGALCAVLLSVGIAIHFAQKRQSTI